MTQTVPPPLDWCCLGPSVLHHSKDPHIDWGLGLDWIFWMFQFTVQLGGGPFVLVDPLSNLSQFLWATVVSQSLPSHHDAVTTILLCSQQDDNQPQTCSWWFLGTTPPPSMFLRKKFQTVHFFWCYVFVKSSSVRIVVVLNWSRSIRGTRIFALLTAQWGLADDSCLLWEHL